MKDWDAWETYCSLLKTPCSINSVKQRSSITLSLLLFVHNTSTWFYSLFTNDILIFRYITYSTFNVTPSDECMNIMAAWLEQCECSFLSSTSALCPLLCSNSSVCESSSRLEAGHGECFSYDGFSLDTVK